VTIAARDFWFYCGKAILPINLTIFYSRWENNLPALAAWFPVLIMAALFFVCWRFRRAWGKHALFGIGCFVILLFPALGFFDAQCFTKFQVSDHLQYLPLIALISLGAGAIASFLREKPFQYTAGGVLLILSLLSFQRAHIFATQERLLRDTLAKNPAAWPVHNDIGFIDANNGRLAEAATHFEIALQFHPNGPDLLANLGATYASQGRLVEACENYHAAIKIKPASPQLREQLARVLEQLGNNTEAISQTRIALHFTSKTETRLNLAGLLFKEHDFSGAIDQFHRVLTLEPDNTTALNNLAYVYLNCPNSAIRNVPAAIELSERACRLTAYKQPSFISTLSAAYREAGRLADATAAAEMASRMQLALSEGEAWPQRPMPNNF
jgi:Flp pilus assembly protein TadD